MLKIKVCGICDPVNLKEVAEAAPDFMGFIFYKGSKRYAGEDTVKDLIALVPDGIIRTGVFVNDKPETILNYAGDLRLDAIQLHGSESPDCCEKIKAGNLIIIKAFGIGENFDFNRLIPYMDTCDYFLFDTKTQSYGGSGRKFNWTRLDEYKFYKKFILSGGIAYEDIEPLRSISHEAFFGVDINSRFESSPGIKNAEMIKSFITGIKS
ncbi:MAG TPA: phosphoribosylanthranilate isomerase [Bacteroidales bacterium]|jgi:phosphoribosylanthranilate isomerase|nr:phosphoribosylanthranilate isomerase [Bacteroidales bacterium]OQB60042.1 MAG: N-(5'-phosphoribosyl)anthranilate isomerase [Bacteroidetes bacterium ADurb.Bin145]NMD03566.1 phosphoribosylanthranilate isomerase [Bacteroidales bacterium]HOU02284.1 phosphoribosylanthranilate isomerase [Bacteroidales bacterium]HQG62746.1 phosphoribosylanthranilate isomerase [Bacteroidales bacterium]